jgi:endonuclease/exonuclease/phosphatase family metal-dependent hydrolase
MPIKLRLATFNIENLFARQDFNAFLWGPDSRSARNLDPIVQFLGRFGDGDLSRFEEFRSLVSAATVAQDDDKRQHTALALTALGADVVALQEVDSHDALRRFLLAYVAKTGTTPFRHAVLHEGNDPRGIDVAVVTQADWPIYTRSHADLTPAWLDDKPSGVALLDKYPRAKAKAKELARQRIFRRDCLEVQLAKAPVTVFNCHFKSMSDGRDETMGMRQLEAITVREIITRRFDDPATALWCVVGDLNDYQQRIKISRTEAADASRTETVEQMSESGVDPLLADGFGQNLLKLLPDEDRWTHYYAAGMDKTQLDYIIASPALAAKIKGKPQIIRAGMPWRVPNSAAVARYPRVGWDRPKASDHCPVVVEFSL